MPTFAIFMFKIKGDSKINFKNAEDLKENPVLAHMLLKLDKAIKCEFNIGADKDDDDALYSSKFFSKESMSCIKEFLPCLHEVWEGNNHFNIQCVIPKL